MDRLSLQGRQPSQNFQVRLIEAGKIAEGTAQRLVQGWVMRHVPQDSLPGDFARDRADGCRFDQRG